MSTLPSTEHQDSLRDSSLDGSLGSNIVLVYSPAVELLETEEIRTQILSHLRADAKDIKQKRKEGINILSAGLTCQQLLEPALDILWENMESLTPLFCVLPAFSRSEDGFYVINGLVSSIQWARLEYYAKRIKAFTHKGAVDNGIALSTYIRIAQHQNSKSLLPSLRRFTANTVNGLINNIFLFVSLSLESIELKNIVATHNYLVGPFLAAIACEETTLRTLILRNGSLSLKSFEPIADLKTLSTLQILDVIQIDDFSLLEIIGTLPLLLDLDLDLSRSSYSTERQSGILTTVSTGFHSLKSVAIVGSFALIYDIVNYVGSTELISCTISPVVHLNKQTKLSTTLAISDKKQITRKPIISPAVLEIKPSPVVVMEYDHVELPSQNSQDLLNIFSTISSRWSHSIKRIVIQQRDLDKASLASARFILWLPQDTFSSLQLIKHLHTFEIHDWSITGLDDIVHSTSPLWTNIQSIFLPINESKLQMLTLWMLAENCPKLQHLQVSVDPNTLPSLGLDDLPLSHALQTLSIGSVKSPIMDQQHFRARVARYINFLFPSVQLIPKRSELSSSSQWEMVYGLVKSCQEVRVDDKRRIP